MGQCVTIAWELAQRRSCVQSHYSVLFATEMGRATSKGGAGAEFDVFYWDGLAAQDEVIRLSVDPASRTPVPDANDDKALIAPLDLVLRTRWAGAAIDWNGTEQIL